MNYTITCCDKMIEQLEEEILIDILTNEPFSPIQTQPTAYICSDGGHGGMEKINYCPFCGKKIELPIVKDNREIIEDPFI